tara:strand:+ start:887 stop:1609 length:723 start_codon:yes stop_codon:yes gene_type:complete
MHKKLIIAVFDKVVESLGQSGVNNPSMSECAKFISSLFDGEKDFGLGEKSFKNYYNQARNLKEGKGDIKIKQVEVIDRLSKYLGYKDYQDFVSDLEKEHASFWSRLLKFIKKRKLEIALLLIAILVILAISWFNRERWMEWQNDHYVEVAFDSNKLSKGLLKIYKKDCLQNFRKIVPDCDTEYFAYDGSVNVWYGKNAEGELECFTDLCKHPETGKTLKAITKYMVQKHFCPPDRKHNTL